MFTDNSSTHCDIGPYSVILHFSLRKTSKLLEKNVLDRMKRKYLKNKNVTIDEIRKRNSKFG